MNTGIIASRYARALCRYVAAHGDAERVCLQAMILERALGEVPGLQPVLEDPAAISAAEKMQLLQSALGMETMADGLKRFLVLVEENGRIGDLRLILHDFIDQYYRSRNVYFATLETAVPVTPEVEDRIRKEASRRVGGTVLLDEKVDPSLIGGAVLTVDGFRVDTSVRTQLEKLLNQFTNKNKRIV